jgi:Cu-Zn family superoxide dismutase
VTAKRSGHDQTEGLAVIPKLHILVATALGGALLLPVSVNAETARAAMVDKQGKSVGTVTMTDSPNGVLVAVELRGLPAGEHAIHIHENGTCSPDFEAAGEHFNPEGKQHGMHNPQGMHAGDLPNLFVASNGVAMVHFLNPHIRVEAGATSVLDGNGSALIVHESADTYRSEDSAGGRIACGVVERPR